MTEHMVGHVLPAPDSMAVRLKFNQLMFVALLCPHSIPTRSDSLKREGERWGLLASRDRWWGMSAPNKSLLRTETEVS